MAGLPPGGMPPGDRRADWRSIEKAGQRRKNPLNRVQKRAQQILSQHGLRLRVGGWILSESVSSQQLLNEVQSGWGGADGIMDVMSKLDSDVSSFNNKFGALLDGAGRSLKDLNPIIDVPRAARKGVWKNSILYGCIRVLAEDAAILNFALTFGGKPLYDDAISLRGFISEKNTERVFTGLLKIHKILLEGNFFSTKPLPIEEFLID